MNYSDWLSNISSTLHPQKNTPLFFIVCDFFYILQNYIVNTMLTISYLHYKEYWYIFISVCIASDSFFCEGITGFMK